MSLKAGGTRRGAAAPRATRGGAAAADAAQAARQAEAAAAEAEAAARRAEADAVAAAAAARAPAAGRGGPRRPHAVGGGNWVVNPDTGNAIKIYAEDAAGVVKQPHQVVKTYAELLAAGRISGNEPRYATKQEALNAGAGRRAGGRARDEQGRLQRVPAAERAHARSAYYNTTTNRANLLRRGTKLPAGAIVAEGDPRAARQLSARTGAMETQVQATERDAKRKATEMAVAAGLSKSKLGSKEDKAAKRIAAGYKPINRKPANPNAMWARAGKVPKNRPGGERAWIQVGGPTWRAMEAAGENMAGFEQYTVAEKDAQSQANSEDRAADRRSTGPNARREGESLQAFHQRGAQRLAGYRNEQFDLVVQSLKNRPIGVQHADGSVTGTARELAHATDLAAGASDAQVVAHIRAQVRSGRILLPLKRVSKMSANAPVRGEEDRV